MLFLSGPPTHGRGSVVASRRELPPTRAQLQLEPLLLDPVYPELTSWTLAEPEKGSERAAASAQQQQQQPQQAPQGQQALQAQAGEQQPGGEAAAGGPAGEVRIDLSHATHDGNGEEVRRGGPEGRASPLSPRGGVTGPSLLVQDNTALVPCLCDAAAHSAPCFAPQPGSTQPLLLIPGCASAAPFKSLSRLLGPSPLKPTPVCTLWQLVVNTEASGFFEEAGVAAAALGVCCDVYALCPHFVGLELVQPLAGRSGGVVRLYHTLDDAPLPQVNWWWGGIRGGGGRAELA